jgi:methylamine dehydrogenase accessory protein MauD
MIDALAISNVILWVVVLALLMAVFALARQIGILYERVAPMGALMIDTGPAVGAAVPRFDLAALDGSVVTVGAPTGRSQLLFFLSPTCPVCKKLIPILKSIAAAEASWLSIVIVSDGEPEEHAAFRRRAALTDFPYVLSAELGMAFRVGKLPYAVLLDEAGLVRAKGLVNSREQIESLFTAKEMNVASVQEFVAGKAELGTGT